MAYQALIACPICGREMRPGGMPKHVGAHRSPRERLTVPPAEQDEMVRLYRSGKSAADISAITFWGKTTVRSVMVANGVRVRPSGGYRREQLPVDEKLRRAELYGQGYSLHEVAEICGCALSSVQDTLIRLGTPRRSRTEANRLRWARSRAARAA